MSKTALYRYYNSKDELLYIGISANPLIRTTQHSQKKPWFDEVSRSSVEWFKSRELALEAEKQAIIECKPKYNIVHNYAKPTSVSELNLVWNCDVCNRPIADGRGYICVSYREMDKTEQARLSWKQKEREAGFGKTSAIVWLNELPDLQPASWQALHGECDPEPDRLDYFYNIERCRTIFQFIECTAHLLGKTWIKNTNWHSICYYVAKQGK